MRCRITIGDFIKRPIACKQVSGVVKAYNKDQLLQKVEYKNAEQRKKAFKILQGVWINSITHFQISTGIRKKLPVMRAEGNSK